MTLISYWHTTPTGEVHKGRSSDCSRCKRRGHVKKTDGLRKHKKVSRRYPAAPTKTCSECGVPISSDNKTGLCLKHYNLRRAHNKKRRDQKSRHCVNPSCRNPIRDSNQSGLCWKCYRDRDVVAQYELHKDEWLQSLEPVRRRT